MNIYIQSGYAFRHGARLSHNLDANAIGKEIAGLRDENGEFTNADVVEAAKPETSAMHTYFEWNDAVAGDLWREDQARYLVRSVVPLVADPRTEDEFPAAERAFISMNVVGTDLEQSGRYKVATVRSGTPQAFTPPAVPKAKPEPATDEPAALIITAPPALLKTPERERALGILQRWAESYSDDPYFAGVVAAIRVLG